ncbi:hypothetical protein [Streptomyces sp. TLI_171]|uniref:hypothetical protein n=1 Tax=Streptomyces sp. TLI_171 TaxID=1938859 RepID=UPI000C175B09|nr:hypothetical protein [Streptomyces sp. TLI_171]RKE18757.1 hypothetical protein BX266_2051 [Streptomyces sp. TLI_171]
MPFLTLLDEDEDEDEAELRLEAAWALAVRDHPRTREAYERVGPLEGSSEHDHRISGLWRCRGPPERPGLPESHQPGSRFGYCERA